MSDPKNGGAGPGAAPGAPTSQRSSNEIPASQAKPREVESVKLPTLELPKGGGAIRGIGEKVSTNAAMGTAGVSVPIKTSPGRGGFGPQLGLSYSSGSGNGIFGLGWGLGVPSVSRRTDKRIPTYDEQDTFLYGDEEELVPQLAGGHPVTYEDVLDGDTREDHLADCERFLPRVEGSHARIERVTESDGNVFWRVTTRDNTTHIFGRSDQTRVVDPDRPTRVYRWLLERTYDDRGNVAEYEYKREDLAGVDPLAVHERNRDLGTCGQRHLKRIYYGNRAPYDLEHAPRAHAEDGFLFVALFDYGEHSADGLFQDLPTTALPHAPAWAHRQDAFSTHRQGFELRTRRLCKRVLMFHRFDVGTPDLVAVTRFSYDESPAAALLTRTWIEGRGNGDTVGPSVLASPPLDFDYAPAALAEAAGRVAQEDLDGLPEGLDGEHHRWVDLNLEGLPGMLTEEGGQWFYKRNEGEGHFGAPSRLPTLPNLAELQGGGCSLQDLGGDGGLQLVVQEPGVGGYFERTPADGWEPFRAFRTTRNVPLSDPNVRLLDLDGDGVADVLVSEDEVFCWYPSMGREGHAPGRVVRKNADEERGPRVLFADVEQSIFLADMSGGGLTDLVRVRNGSVCYWPNLGYGRFGAKVTMSSPPRFAAEGMFRPDRLRLADTDGSGTTDLIYLGARETRLWRNLSGNRFDAAEVIKRFPSAGATTQVTVTDFLGRGTMCLLASTPRPGEARASLRYVDLFSGQKPRLLRRVRNNLGAETEFHYAQSTRFYLEDRAAGQPWVTKLPFPVQVVERVVTRDLVTGSEHAASYRYHHGYYDRTEKEFRGFGMVEQTDAESFAPFVGRGLFAEGDAAVMAVPPVVTRTWTHTGAWFEGRRIEEHFREHEYYRGAAASFRGEDHVLDARLPITVLPEGLTPSAQREACRALRGRTLRVEVYAHDGTGLAGVPYQVTETNFQVRVVQAGGPHAVVRVDPGETLTFQTERDDADPRVAHTLTLAVDAYGTVTRTIAAVYPRRVPFAAPLGMAPEAADAIVAAQARLYLTYGETEVANLAGATGPYRLGVPLASRSYEVVWKNPPTNRFFRADDFTPVLALPSSADVVAPAVPGPTSASETPTFQRRLLESSRSLYWNEARTAPLPLPATLPLDPSLAAATVGPRALPFETRVAAFTDALLDAVYGARIPPSTDAARATLLKGEGAYLYEDGFWWARSGCARPSRVPADFYLPDQFYDAWYVDQVGADDVDAEHPVPKSTVEYDDYKLFPKKTTDALGNVVQLSTGYHLLQPTEVIDPNGNRTRARYDALGRVVETYAMGRDDADGGDVFPDGGVTGLPGAVFTYSLADHDPQTFVAASPVWAKAQVRTQHRVDAFEEATVYSDGFGRELLTKKKVEPATTGGADRWIGSGRTVYDNKGNAVKKYEPYFSATGGYEAETALHTDDPWRGGVTPVLHYDALGRLIETELPDGTRTRVVFSAWHEEHWDPNDTVAGSAWAAACAAMPATDPRKAAQMVALAQALTHRATPTTVYLDTLARPVVSTADNTHDGGTRTLYATRVTLDVQGRQSEVIDALGRRVQWQGFDLLGRTLWTRMMDASGGPGTITLNPTMPDALDTAAARMLPDVAGQTLRKWTERGYEFHDTYDVARRLIEVRVRRRDDPTLTGSTVITPEQLPVMTEYLRYGEGLAELDPTTYGRANLRGRLWRVYDGAGRLEHRSYDFHGHLAETERRLSKAHQGTVDWSATATAVAASSDPTTAENAALRAEAFRSSSTFDALGRVLDVVPPQSTSGIAPTTHARLVRHTYNQAGLLATVGARFGSDASALMPVVVGITYNARRQRCQVVHGNGLTTKYKYDGQSFRLTRLSTTRATDDEPEMAQDLRYTYDAAGNVVAIADQTGVAEHRLVSALSGASTSDYTYDSLYRLTEAAGREHPAAAGVSHSELLPESGRFAHANDLTGLVEYVEQYTYDEVGNLHRVRHVVAADTTQSWTRDYRYAEGSNRLLSTSLPGDVSGLTAEDLPVRYSYDEHGNMTEMPHLPTMAWNAYEELIHTVSQGDASRREHFFQYDAHGQRARKSVERWCPDAAGAAMVSSLDERVYFGGYELLRKHGGDDLDATVEREVQTLHMMDGEQRLALHDARTVQLGTGAVVETPTVDARVTRLRYQHGNHLGSACLETDSDGALVSYEEYHPYGTTALEYRRDNADDERKRYRFTGMERDETGLQYHSARYYAPWLGRWTSPDPIGIGDGGNVYAYASSRPTVRVDLDGRQHRNTIPPAFSAVPPYARFNPESIQMQDWVAAGAGRNGTTPFPRTRSSSERGTVRVGGSSDRGQPSDPTELRLSDVPAIVGGVAAGTSAALTPFGVFFPSRAPQNRTERNFMLGRMIGEGATGGVQLIHGIGLLWNGVGTAGGGGALSFATGGAASPLAVAGVAEMAAGFAIAAQGVGGLRASWRDLLTLSHGDETVGNNDGSTPSSDSPPPPETGQPTEASVNSIEELSRAAGAPDRQGLTVAGRALQKHGGRPGSAFPLARGTNAQINEQGQRIVDEILQSPGLTRTSRHHARFGQVLELRAPDGRGVRYTETTQTFIGFLEPGNGAP